MKKRNFMIFGALMFVGILFVLSFVGYSDGDDAFFYQYANQMGLFEYLSWRYETWVGRMAAEALVWVTFRSGIWFWRVVNAAMLLCLPVGIAGLAGRIVRGDSHRVGDEACLPSRGREREGEAAGAARAWFGAVLICFCGYLWMDAMTLGYAAVWVNGSIFYTWSFTCGIFALFPAADAVFGRKRAPWYAGWYALPCCVIAAMSIEQMGAVLLTLEIIACAVLLGKRRAVPVLLAVQTALTALSFATLFLAPGNELRIAQETQTWMPMFDTLSVGEHLFLTLQWLLSSFANENSVVLCALWMFLAFVLWERKKRVLLWPLALFAVAGVLRFFGVSLFCDMGMGEAAAGGQVLSLPAMSELTAGNIFAMVWWSAALVYTLVLLVLAARAPVTMALVYLAGIASEAIMYFSPTMYASGARVFYLTDLCVIFLTAGLFLQIENTKRRRWAFGLALFTGILHFGVQIPAYLAAGGFLS